MKNNYILLFIIIFVIIIFPTSAYCVSISNEKLESIYHEKNALIKEFGLDYKNIIKKNNRELSVGKNVDDYIKANFKKIPDFYGGMYISDDSEHLILQIVKENIPNNDSKEYELYIKMLNIDPSIQVNYVKYSYNELNNANDNYFALYSNDEDYVSNYIDIKNNNIIVNNKNIKKYSKTNSINNDLDDLFVVKEGAFEEYSSLKAGSKINVNSNTYCSMGFRTKYKGNKGYVTAGHCTKGVGTSIASGTVKLRKIGGKVDFSFVKAKSSYTLSNSLAYPGDGVSSIYSTNYCPLIIVGAIIGKSGATTSYTYGTITSVNYSGKDAKGNKYTNLVSASAGANGGDSGGPVFANGSGLLYGIVTGGNPYDTNESLIFSNINNFPSSIINGLY